MKGKYAFLDFRDLKDAELAVKEMNNQMFMGTKVVVEHVRKDRGGRGSRAGP